jgi:hypothetical protein
LKFAPVAPATPPASVYQAPVTRDLPVPEERQVHRRAHYVTREDLYRLVWEAPVSEVANRFGISDVGLAKACRRAGIPIPPRGYWAKVEAGHFIEQPPLPPSPPGLRDKIRLNGRRIKQNRDASRTVAVELAA